MDLKRLSLQPIVSWVTLQKSQWNYAGILVDSLWEIKGSDLGMGLSILVAYEYASVA